MSEPSGQASGLAEALSAIEVAELGLLAWGVHQASMTEAELHELVTRSVGGEASSVIEELIERAAVVRGPDGGYRSRMAETIHVLASIRQTFPNRPWNESPELVLDYRVLQRPRRRPRRERPAAELIDSSAHGLRSVARDAMSAIVPGDVAGFQVRSADAIGAALRSEADAGVVVAAGTGSGKTLAFYAPAIAWIIDSIAQDPGHSVRALAVYPRNELLKDQLSTAVGHSVRLAEAGIGLRPIRVGAWFGAVPTAPLWVKNGWSTGWKVVGPRSKPIGWTCPYLDCLRCGGELVWSAIDLDAGVERLTCHTPGCGFVLGSDVLALTRNSAKTQPPDLMFTTAESLNRQMASPDAHRAFGLDRRRPVRMVLLDEIHTYEGTTGAQTAFLLRRLRNAIGPTPVVFAGLSATLLRAQEFFASLTGVAAESVSVVEPTSSELEESGAEYQLAIRHNSASQTSPLSTTIQTAFALERCLDPRGDGGAFGPATVDSGGLFGSRTFVFTDKLDVTNRLYWNLLDAEGWWDEGRPKANRVPTTLAHLRSEGQARVSAANRMAAQDRLASGQWWWLAEQLGHGIGEDDPLHVGRTSSQDQGVSEVDIIVATATLEVGYDDDRVGAVIQHRAPHDAARFLQRKGRAGRRPEMRPWTVVVLTDWGRDRFSWQGYDQLFDPMLEASRLPVGNRYVRRMQAVYSTLDWLARKVTSPMPDRNLWADLAGPADLLESKVDRRTSRRDRQETVGRIIAEVLNGGPARAQLADHLKWSLRLESAEIDALLWSPPRPLMLAVLPTALRRLRRQWEDERPRADDPQLRQRTPLSEFVTGNLFDDLLLPEVEVRFPTDDERARQKEPDHLPALRVLREFLPGNVTRHFGVDTFERRHWVPVPALEGGPAVVDVGAFGAEHIRSVRSPDGDVAVYRPVSVQLERPPEEILDSSSSRPVWNACIEPFGAGARLDLPSAWQRVIEITAHMHADGDGVRMCRYTSTATGSFKTKDGESVLRVEFRSGSPEAGRAALGVEFDVDAIRLRIRIPEPPTAISSSERSLYLIDLIHEDEELAAANWVTRSAVASALTVVIANGGIEAVTGSNDAALSAALVDALELLGSTAEAPDSTEPGELVSASSIIRTASGLDRLRAASRRAGAQERDADWLEWHARRAGVTFATMFVEAAGQFQASFDPSEVAIDVMDRASSDDECIDVWISELAPGGNGLVEALMLDLQESTATFRSLVLGAVTPGPLEVLDVELVRRICDPEGRLAGPLSRLRTSWSEGLAAVEAAITELRSSAELDDGSIARSVVGVLATRLAGPGSSDATFDVCAGLLQRWTQTEEAIGFSIDARVFGAHCADLPSVDEAFGRSLSRQQRARAIAGLFWPRGLDSVTAHEVAGATFSDLPKPDPSLFQGHLPEAWPLVACTSADDALDAVKAHIVDTGSVAVRVATHATARDAIRAVLVTPVEDGAIFVYPRVMSVLEVVDGVEIVFAAAPLEF